MGEPIISWILATWSSSFDPGNRGRRLWEGREKKYHACTKYLMIIGNTPKMVLVLQKSTHPC